MHSFSSFKSLLLFGEEQLHSNGISNYKKECQWMILDIIKKELPWLITNIDTSPTEKEIDRFLDFIDRRKNHTPLQLIMERATFYGRDFLIHPGVFIPRQSSEIIVDVLKKKNFPHCLKLA